MAICTAHIWIPFATLSNKVNVIGCILPSIFSYKYYNAHVISFLGKMCVLDCAPSALKMLHNSTEFMPYVVFIAAPGMEQLKNLYAERRATGGSQRNLAVSRWIHIKSSFIDIQNQFHTMISFIFFHFAV